MVKRIFLTVGFPLGILSGFLSLAAFGMLWLMQVQFVFAGYKFAGFLIPFVIMAFAMKRFRDVYNAGGLQLAEGFMVGAVTAFVSTFLTGFCFWLLLNFYQAMWPAAISEAQALLLLNKAKLTDEAYQEAFHEISEITKNRVAWDLTLKPLQFLFFLNLASALFFRRITR